MTNGYFISFREMCAGNGIAAMQMAMPKPLSSAMCTQCFTPMAPVTSSGLGSHVARLRQSCLLYGVLESPGRPHCFAVVWCQSHMPCICTLGQASTCAREGTCH